MILLDIYWRVNTKEQDCKKCHNQTFITDSKIKKKEYTFLGLDASCLSCHEDQHRETLSKECIDCHGFEAFSSCSIFRSQQVKFSIKRQT